MQCSTLLLTSLPFDIAIQNVTNFLNTSLHILSHTMVSLVYMLHTNGIIVQPNLITKLQPYYKAPNDFCIHNFTKISLSKELDSLAVSRVINQVEFLPAKTPPSPYDLAFTFGLRCGIIYTLIPCAHYFFYIQKLRPDTHELDYSFFF